MDKLPTFLLKAIESACDLYSCVNYTVHGDDNKARISIMFTQNDNKQTPRKSKSTTRRDTKRMMDYIETKNNNELNTKSNAFEDDNVHVVNKDVQTNSQPTNMEVESYNVRQAVMDKNEIQNCKVANKCGIKSRQINTKPDVEIVCKSAISESKSVQNNKKRIKEIETVKKSAINERKTVQNNTERIKETKTAEISMEKNEDINIGKITIDDEILLDSNMILSKVVVKHSRFSPDKYIAMVKGSNRLVMFDSQNEEVEEVEPSNPYYDTYRQNVEKDFDDVRYKYMCDTLDTALNNMSIYALDNDLYDYEHDESIEK